MRISSISKAIFGVLFIGFLSNTALAGESSAGQISGVLAHTGGFFFNSSGARSSSPTCATVVNRWVINTGTSQGQAIVAALLTAQASRKRVYVRGTGGCATWSDTEAVEYILIED